MHWYCPHCGASLAVAEEKLGAGWVYSKCYQCIGYMMVRKPDVNLIKIDKAPSGERVVFTNKYVNGAGATSAGPAQFSKEKPIQGQLLKPRSKNLNVLTTKILSSVFVVILSMSGFYFYRHRHQLFDPVKQQSSAPVREIAGSNSPSTVQAPIPTAPNPIATENVISASQPAEFKVRSAVHRAQFRSGPGTEYPVLGTADPDKSYLVSETQDRWYKVILNVQASEPNYAWIRNDLVRISTE